MKVLAIRGRNIASLAEDFEVDLQAEPLASVNLFAIAGPTGSGKSSLLDALCLALYDQTPRLRSAPTQGSKLPDGETGELGASDSRQLLRRGASEGFAEVDFVGIDGQRWRARWSVRRARGRRDGRLQAVEMSLLQLPEQMAAPGTGKKTETLAEIERRVGLGYRQFTHAVLLAQNEFAAFLRADQDERARLLQTLTGSERFERLSVAAYERSRQEREALLRIEQELSNHRPLDEAARAKLDEAADTARRDHEAAQIRWDQDRHWLAWVQERQRRQAAVDGARARRSEAETALNQASEQRHHIARLRLLQPIRQLWLKVDDIALRLTAQRSELSASRQQLQLRQTRVAETEQRLSQAQASADQQRTHAAERQPEIENAEGLDRQIAQTESLLVTATEARGTAKSEEAEAARALDEAQSQAERLQQAAQQSGREIETRESDAILLPHGVPWRAQIDSLQQLRPQLATHAQTLREHETQAQQLSHDLARLGADLEELDTVIEQCREGLEQRVLALRALSTTDLAARRAQLHADTEKLRARQDALRALAALRRSRRALSDALAQAEAERLAVDQALPQAGIDLSAAEAAATQAERALSAARIATAEAADGLRATLEATRPCPVCGSLEHPWDDPARLLHDLGAQAADNRTDALRQLLATLAAQHATARQAELDQRDHLLSLRRRGEALVASIQQDHRALAELAQDIEQQRQ
ncbi:MAG: AAA family ATPase, partial [Xanthomonadales bacterium]|nr:AAA family ATPase [Xanthomonadales bacterium]